MAKKTEKTTAPEMVTIAMLAEEYGVEGKDIRVVLRANGFKAPEANTPEGTFGPRAKYQWPEGSKELVKVRKVIEDAISDEPAEAPAKPANKGKGKAKPEETEEDEEEDDE